MQVSQSASRILAVTPSDSESILPNEEAVTRLYVGTTGHVRVITKSGDIAVFIAVPPGTFLDVRAVFVTATTTTAGDIVALYD